MGLNLLVLSLRWSEELRGWGFGKGKQRLIGKAQMMRTKLDVTMIVRWLTFHDRMTGRLSDGILRTSLCTIFH